MMTRAGLRQTEHHDVFGYVCEVRLRNFRGFRKQTIPLAPLTFLVGPNSGGKSSILDALMFVAQSDFLQLRGHVPAWAGRLVDLGSFADTVHAHNTTNKISIAVEFELRDGDLARRTGGRPGRRVSTEVELRSTKDPVGALAKASLTDGAARVTVSRKRGNTVAYRIEAGGNSVDWPQSQNDSRWPGSLGETAFKAARKVYSTAVAERLLMSSWRSDALAMMQRVSSARAAPERLYRRQSADVYERGYYRQRVHDGVDPDELSRHAEPLSNFLAELGVADRAWRKATSAYHNEILVNDSRSNVTSNLVEVGFGASQALPIAMALVTSRPGLLAVEQPEVHLHPRAQGVLARRLVAASRRRQILVETHSEHMINAARIMVAERKIPASHMRILYVDRDAQGSHVKEIRVDAGGRFVDAWPDGFFEERTRDTVALARLQAAVPQRLKRFT